MIRIGSEITMHFTIKLEDNSIAETTKKGQPSVFIMTEESLHDPLESQLMGKKAGDKVRVKLSPDQAYGASLPDSIHRLPRDRFPLDVTPELGDIYQFDRPDGSALPGVIMEVNDNEVKVDFNHPLAGKTLLVELEVLHVK